MRWTNCAVKNHFYEKKKIRFIDKLVFKSSILFLLNFVYFTCRETFLVFDNLDFFTNR